MRRYCRFREAMMTLYEIVYGVVFCLILSACCIGLLGTAGKDEKK